MEMETISTTKLIIATQHINLSDLKKDKIIPFKFSTEDSHTYSGFIYWFVSSPVSQFDVYLYVIMSEVAFLQIEFKDIKVSRASGKETSLTRKSVGIQSREIPNSHWCAIGFKGEKINSLNGIMIVKFMPNKKTILEEKLVACFSMLKLHKNSKSDDEFYIQCQGKKFCFRKSFLFNIREHSFATLAGCQAILLKIIAILHFAILSEYKKYYNSLLNNE